MIIVVVTLVAILEVVGGAVNCQCRWQSNEKTIDISRSHPNDTSRSLANSCSLQDRAETIGKTISANALPRCPVVVLPKASLQNGLAN